MEQAKVNLHKEVVEMMAEYNAISYRKLHLLKDLEMMLRKRSIKRKYWNEYKAVFKEIKENQEIEKKLSNKLYNLFDMRTLSMGNWFNVVLTKDETYFNVSQDYIDGDVTDPEWVGEGSTYAKSSKWTAKHAFFILYLNYSDTFDEINNVLTFYKRGTLNRNEVVPVRWLKQGRGVKVSFVEGWLYKGYHIKAKTAAAAKKIIDKKRKGAAEQILQQRAKTRRENEIQNMQPSHIFVSLEDVKKAGNCMPGINNFCRQNHIDLQKTGGVRADYLMTLAEQSGVVREVNRSIEIAKAKYL